MALDLDSNKTVEYHIADLDVNNSSKFDKVFKHMTEHFLRDEPLSKAFGKITSFKLPKKK